MNGENFLEWLETRRSVREFEDKPIPREVLERVLHGGITAPSASNRQPWKFSVVTDETLKSRIVSAIRENTEEMKEVISQSHHAEDFASYGDFFHEPLEAAQVLVIPQYRTHTDLIARLIESGGGEPADFHTPSEMQDELCSTAAACMTMLLQAKAEGLGAVWMAGPTVAKDEIHELLDIRPPWQMLGGMALGYPAEEPVKKPRKSLELVVDWY